MGWESPVLAHEDHAPALDDLSQAEDSSNYDVPSTTWASEG
jgi:hypothetical protein